MPSESGNLHKQAVRGHRPDFVDRLRQRHELDVGRDKGHHHPVLAGIEAPYCPGPVSQPQLAVDGGGCAAPDPKTQDQWLGFLGDQQLQPVGHGLGGLARSLDDVLTGFTRCQRRQRSLEGIAAGLSAWACGSSTNSAPSATTTSP